MSLIDSERPPLFTPADDSISCRMQELMPEQLDMIAATIPICSCLLEAMSMLESDSNISQQVASMLSEIVSSPSNFFPEVPMRFERSEPFSLVPDDGKLYFLNWKSIIFQIHLSIVRSPAWKQISSSRRSHMRSLSEDFGSIHQTAPEKPRVRQSMFEPRSFAIRKINSCIGSFADKVGVESNVGSLRYDVVPPISRAESKPPVPIEKIDITPIFDVKLSLSSILFHFVILSIQAKGLLDYALGFAIPLPQDILFAYADPTTVFDAFSSSLSKCLFSQAAENELIEKAASDSIRAVLDSIESLLPFNCVPHSKSFLETILIPLCFHENSLFAKKACSLLSILQNGHQMDVSSVSISTVGSTLSFPLFPDRYLIVCSPLRNESTFSILNGKSFSVSSPGFYDFFYAKLSPSGSIDFDLTLPSSRYIVLPHGVRKEVIHELPCFDSNGPLKFELLCKSLQSLASIGVTAVHIPGAIESKGDLLSIRDHTSFSKSSGEGFLDLCAKAKSLGIRVLCDFMPTVSLRDSSRKYSRFSTLKMDSEGRLVTATIDKSLILNFRSVKLWSLLCDEATKICESTGGIFLGSLGLWDYILPRDKRELFRIDCDNFSHYDLLTRLEGTIIEDGDSCGLFSHFDFSPLFCTLMRKLWASSPTAFVWMKCSKNEEGFVARSGIIPQTNELADLIREDITTSVYSYEIEKSRVACDFQALLEERHKNLPKGTVIVSSFGSLTDPDPCLPIEGISLAVSILFFFSDIPLIYCCLDSKLYLKSAYDFGEKAEAVVSKPDSRFSSLLKDNALIRTRGEWILDGETSILRVTYNSMEMNAILAILKQNGSKYSVIFISFYPENLIFEVSIKDIPLVKDADSEAVLEVKPILSNSAQSNFYQISEVSDEGGLFFDIGRFSTSVSELLIRDSRETSVKRAAQNGTAVRLYRAIHYNSNSILASNRIFNSIQKSIESMTSFENPLLSNEVDPYRTFREALFLAARSSVSNGKISQITSDDQIADREKRIISLLKSSKSPSLAKVLTTNNLGPVFFVTPELGPFSKVGGVSTMVWDLVRELATLGVDVTVISPYYNVNSKGETGYLKKWNIEYSRTIDVYAPDKYEVGIHYGVVEGVKLFFLHHYSFFSAPYQTGSPAFRLQVLVLFAKATLELCCQLAIIPSLFVTNDWMAGLVPTYARHTFGPTFSGTKFLHIIHNLGTGYTGKLWPNDGENFYYIHNLPEDSLVDSFDHSIDPSLSALLCCDQWATVSKRYREDLIESSQYGLFLRRFPHPFAFSNGIRVNERLKETEKVGSHEEAKRKLQKKCFGEVDDSKCLFVFVGRIVEQKGVYLIIDSFEELHKQFGGKLQFVVGGQAAIDDRVYGQPCTARMWDLKNRYPKNFWADPSQFFGDGVLAVHGADYVLIPSLFEPSGIVQQEAFASGTPVIAFRTGGLADTVFEFDRTTQKGNGFTFWAHRHRDFVMAVNRAVDLWNEKELYWKMRKNAFESVLPMETAARAWAREFYSLFMKIYDGK